MVKEILNEINLLEGSIVRIREIHFSASSMSLHKLCDEVKDAVSDFYDNIAEDAQAIYGQIQVGEINPTLPNSTNLVDLLIEIRSLILRLKDNLKESMYTGIINECDDMFHRVNKFIYLARICEKGHSLDED